MELQSKMKSCGGYFAKAFKVYAYKDIICCYVHQS